MIKAEVKASRSLLCPTGHLSRHNRQEAFRSIHDRRHSSQKTCWKRKRREVELDRRRRKNNFAGEKNRIFRFGLADGASLLSSIDVGNRREWKSFQWFVDGSNEDFSRFVQIENLPTRSSMNREIELVHLDALPWREERERRKRWKNPMICRFDREEIRSRAEWSTDWWQIGRNVPSEQSLSHVDDIAAKICFCRCSRDKGSAVLWEWSPPF